MSNFSDEIFILNKFIRGNYFQVHEKDLGKNLGKELKKK